MVWISLGILVLILWIDLTIKKYVEDHFEPNEEVKKQNGAVLIRFVKNKGMALNILDRYPIVVRFLSFGIVLPASVYYFWLLFQKGRTVEKISFSLLLGGALSNLYDRFVRKYVVDYVGFRTKWEKITNITYNLGDFAIFIGAIGLVVCQWMTGKK